MRHAWWLATFGGADQPRGRGTSVECRGGEDRRFIPTPPLDTCLSPLAEKRKFSESRGVAASAVSRGNLVASLQLPGTVWIGSRSIAPVRRLQTGVESLDVLLDGGFPRGCLNEIAGVASSGRTALVCALLASATRRGEVVAVVDLPDALCPESLHGAGVDLDRILWVRPPTLKAGLKCAELILSAGGFGLVVLDLCLHEMRGLPLHVWPRLARAARQADTTLTILAPRCVAGSFAAVRLTLRLQRAKWGSGPWRMFEGLATGVVVARNRAGTPGRRGVLSVEKCA